jgi:spermidine synthase
MDATLAADALQGYRTVARTASRDCSIDLRRRGGRYVITSCRQVLMTNEDTRSERALGRLTARRVRDVARPRVLVGGLGMGFTLRALLDGLPKDARVVVAELLPAVARWNRRMLGHLAGHPVRDGRVSLRICDVARLLPGRPRWDAIVLDIDNGPDWLVERGNGALYSVEGLRRLMRSLRARGTLVVWSADRHRRFERRLTSITLPWRRYRIVSGGQPEPSPAVLYEIGNRTQSPSARTCACDFPYG